MMRCRQAASRRTIALAGGLEAASFVVGPALGGLLVVAGGISRGSPARSCASWPPDSPVRSRTWRAPNRRAHRVRSCVGRSHGCCGLHIRQAIVAVVAVNALTGLLAIMLVRLPSELGGRGQPVRIDVVCDRDRLARRAGGADRAPRRSSPPAAVARGGGRGDGRTGRNWPPGDRDTGVHTPRGHHPHRRGARRERSHKRSHDRSSPRCSACSTRGWWRR